MHKDVVTSLNNFLCKMVGFFSSVETDRRSMSLPRPAGRLELDFSDPKCKSRFLSKIIMVALSLVRRQAHLATQPPSQGRIPSVVNLFPSPSACIFGDVHLHISRLKISCFTYQEHHL